MKINKFVIYLKKIFVLIKIKKNLKRSRKSEIMIIIQESIEELIIVFVI